MYLSGISVTLGGVESVSEDDFVGAAKADVDIANAD
jgi:hypothetical protein